MNSNTVRPDTAGYFCTAVELWEIFCFNVTYRSLELAMRGLMIYAVWQRIIRQILIGDKNIVKIERSGLC